MSLTMGSKRKGLIHRSSYKIVDGERISERGGNWFTRSFGAGYPDLDSLVEQLEKHRVNDAARQAAGPELPRSVRCSALSLKETAEPWHEMVRSTMNLRSREIETGIK
jgi:hypothetical protein